MIGRLTGLIRLVRLIVCEDGVHDRRLLYLCRLVLDVHMPVRAVTAAVAAARAALLVRQLAKNKVPLHTYMNDRVSLR